MCTAAPVELPFVELVFVRKRFELIRLAVAHKRRLVTPPRMLREAPQAHDVTPTPARYLETPGTLTPWVAALAASA